VEVLDACAAAGIAGVRLAVQSDTQDTGSPAATPRPEPDAPED